MLKILLIEPYYRSSHRAWADGYARFSQHHVRLLTLPGQFWKWRMQGGAVTLARMFMDGDFQPDVILASDMFDLSIFRALTRSQTDQVPIAFYFHENQLTYPQNIRQRHGWKYGFINYASALSADKLFFNSAFHLNDFLDELPRMLKHFGDFNELQTVDTLREKSHVLPLGLDLHRLDIYRSEVVSHHDVPVILWNHRWEEDKNPATFLAALHELSKQGVAFGVVLAGENFQQTAKVFDEARQWLGDRVIHYGYAEDFEIYAKLLWQSDYVISTAYQDFFGISVTEGIYCGCIPLLPHRLNYPYLLPDTFHEQCLYSGDKLLSLLQQHLNGTVTTDVTTLQNHVAQYDWTIMAAQYDAVLAAMVD